jgi:3-oxoacyl-[acyl-carrier-protein] synthase II
VKVVVTGMGMASALGDMSASWQQLLQGNSGLCVQQPFPALSPQYLGLMGASPIALVSLGDRVVADTLRDARLKPPLNDCAVVVGSSRGCQGDWERMGRNEADLSLWLERLLHQGAIAAARQVGTTSAVFAPMAACATGLWAIARGAELIWRGEYQRVIAGALEAPITPLTLAGFAKMGALSKSRARPFDKQRDGFVLGEGGALFLLETEASAKARGAKIYGEILGFGLTADGYHLSAPDIEGNSAAIAIQQCLQRSHLTSSDIDYIHAHGTSTILNDRNEARLIQALFPPSVAVSSTKGATGHTLGASGALGVAFTLLALHQQVLPPCTGLNEPEFELNFVTTAQRSEINRALVLSFGFGGQNAAIALSRYAH